MKQLITGCIGVLLCLNAAAAPVELNPQHPQRYVVKANDTLWNISSTFLKKPWQWSEVWQRPSNPKRLYPGDVLAAYYSSTGKPTIRVESNGSVRLSPRVRSTKLIKAVPTIHLTHIKPFLTDSKVLSLGQYEKAPYVLASTSQRVAAVDGNQIYVRGELEPNVNAYTIFRQGEVYKDPKTKEVLGVSAIHVGNAELQKRADPSTLLVTRVREEIQKGYRLCPDIDAQVKPYFFPHAPKTDMSGKIIAVLKGVSQIGRNDIVVLNKGEHDGLDVGTVFAIAQEGGSVVDENEKAGFLKRPKKIKLPNFRVGELMVFRTFDRVSYALVMKAREVVEVGDNVVNP